METEQTRTEQVKEALTSKIRYNNEQFAKLNNELLGLNEEMDLTLMRIKRRELNFSKEIFEAVDENGKAIYSNQTKRDAAIETKKQQDEAYKEDQERYNKMSHRKNQITTEMENLKWSQRTAFKQIDYEIAIIGAKNA